LSGLVFAANILAPEKIMGLIHAQGLRKFCQDQSGNELVEFALSMVIFFTVIFGIIDCSRALYADHYVAYVANEATRYAMVRGSSWQGTSCTTPSTFSCDATASNITNMVTSITPLGFVASNLSVTSTWPGTTPTGSACATTNGVNSPGCIVQVTVKYSFNFVLPFLPANTLNLQSTSAVAISK
jgi:Flp pilus assembly protein TadG